MHIFESPIVILSLLGICFVLLMGIGIHFAVRGIKTANEEDEYEFSSISKLESDFIHAGKQRNNRCILYISVDLGNYTRLYSKEKTAKVFFEIKQILLDFFSGMKNSSIALYGDNNFVVLNDLDAENTRNTIKQLKPSLIKCLLNFSALKLVDIRIGSFFAFGSDISFDESINRAKQASFLAKKEQLPYAEWNITSGKALEKKIQIENNIEKEIDNNHFFLEYQPVLDAKTKEIVGAEVLSRLNSETDGVLSPGSFLSAVDSVGINNKFDYYIFEKNCKWISNDKKQREGYKYTINFSRSTLSDPVFPEKIVSIAEKYGLNFSCLAVEILEDKQISGEAREQMSENLTALKEKGVSILLDDFGSGYTTFGDLRNLDISIVKIDRNITQSSVTEAGFIILQNIIRTAKDIGFKTLCEGVETREQEEAAIRAGCDLLQGFYYYRPMSVTRLERLLEQEEKA